MWFFKIEERTVSGGFYEASITLTQTQTKTFKDMGKKENDRPVCLMSTATTRRDAPEEKDSDAAS